MKLLRLGIQDAYLIQFTRYYDERGYLQEVYNHESFPAQISGFFSCKTEHTIKIKAGRFVAHLI